METNIEVKEKGATVKLTPQSSKQDPCDTDCILSPKRIKAIISQPEVVLTSSTDPSELNNKIKKVIEVCTKNIGLELVDVKLSTTPMPETDKLNPHVEYSALLIFREA